MSNDNAVLRAITKLTELTQDKKVQWEKSSDTEALTSGTDDVVDAAYYATHARKRLCVYELKFKEIPDGPWTSMPVLELVGSDGTMEWRFPQTAATQHLLDAVRYQLSGVEDFIKELAEDPTTAPITDAEIVAAFARIQYLKPSEVFQAAATCRRHLAAAGITMRSQLYQLVESKEILPWLEGTYIRELLRPPEAPLDPLAVANWGGQLLARGFTEQEKARILDTLRHCAEYKEKHSKLA